MFDFITNKKVLVSGPQRSGTRICARMISNDIGLSYIDETDIPEFFRSQDREVVIDAVQNLINGDVSGLRFPPRDVENFVLHCPPFMPWIHLVKGVFVVIMRRPIEDIERSMKRINWKENLQELEYNKIGFTRFGEPKPGYVRTNSSLAKLKYNFWNSYQRKHVMDHVEIEYNDLGGHSMWIHAEDRINFWWGQVSKDLIF
jgi:hypothetical protein